MDIDAIVQKAYDAKMNKKNPLDLKRVKDFIDAWHILEDKGLCDYDYGMQFERVLLKWMLSGHPSNIKTFIKNNP